mmetsp:Transcript_19390/g.19678  ORF Transcript_19390/g.19678 Transcript_19390/m.19678 type:complete len:84 (+) Transcript_19390:692-943(+)
MEGQIPHQRQPGTRREPSIGRVLPSDLQGVESRWQAVRSDRGTGQTSTAGARSGVALGPFSTNLDDIIANFDPIVKLFPFLHL